MIIVAGTKRSGTSMWMQILRDAGLPIFGRAFSGDWDTTIREANPEGFYESWFRNGINFATNPHPQTGDYVHPSKVRGHGVKVFIPGLIRSDLAFIERVVGTMRDWREYDASVRRLYAMEYENKLQKAGQLPQVYVDPVLEWWSENHGLLADHITRLYPLHWVTYEETLTDPERVVTEVVKWLRVGDAEAALKTVKPSLSTQRGAALPPSESVSSEHAAVFDELYRRVRERVAFDQDFIDTLNATNEALLPKIEAEVKRVAAVRQNRKQKTDETITRPGKRQRKR